MPRKIDLTNQRFGRLLVIGEAGKSKAGHYLWECKCDCGNLTTVNSYHLRSGAIKSCGCLRTERNIAFNKETKVKHGMRYTRLYHEWLSMRHRCNSKKYKYYGGRGIDICPEWRDSFEAFRDWAFANGYQDDLTLDRKDNDKGYCPDNCRWATPTEQANNRRNNHLITYNGKTQTISQWAEELGIPKHRIYKRVEMNMPTDKILHVGKLPTKK